MFDPPAYTFDAGRLAELASFDILDTPAEQGFDDIVQLAVQICATPVALVSLVAADRQWFKARIGFEQQQTCIESAVCAHALIEPDLLIINDLTADPRTRANPLVVGPPHIRFYAGAPLRVSADDVLGTLCVIDNEPRPGGLTAAQAAGLRNLARQVVSQLVLRRALAERDRLVARQRVADGYRTGFLRIVDQIRDAGSAIEMTEAVCRILGSTLGVMRVGFGRFTDDDAHVEIEHDWTADGADSLTGRYRIDLFKPLWAEVRAGQPAIIADIRQDARTAANPESFLAAGAQAACYVPVHSQGRVAALLTVHESRPRDWSDDAVTLLRHVAERLENGLSRLAAQAAQEMLTHELGHRLKNTFATIQAIAHQTLKSVPDKAPVEAFNRRLLALAGAHDLLLGSAWTKTRVGALIQAVLAPLVDMAQLDIAGPDVEIGPRATLSTALLLHEMATNALKYGALTGAAGRVAVRWRFEEQAGAPGFTLTWQERGGPPVQPPARRGFGSRLIGMGLVGNGGVDLRYEPAGFAATFQAPLDQVQTA